jgi:hypothetical protein
MKHKLRLHLQRRHTRLSVCSAGSHPAVRGHVHIAKPATEDAALEAQIEAALPASRQIESAAAHLKIVHSG